MSWTTKQIAGSISATLLDMLLPHTCPGCDAIVPSDRIRIQAGFCHPCWQSTLLTMTPCVKCGTPHVGPVCSGCRSKTPCFASVRAPFIYGGPVARGIQRAKYRGAIHILKMMGIYLQGQLDEFPRFDVVVPVPLHRRRLRKRGYNQAAVLSRYLVKDAKIPLDYKILTRNRDTPSQAGLNFQARRENLAGAFSAHRRGKIPGRILLVDDVMTTGATVTACARALLSAGVTDVHVLTLARAAP